MNDIRYSVAISEAIAVPPNLRLLCLCGDSHNDSGSVSTMARHLAKEGWRVTVMPLASTKNRSTSFGQVALLFPTVWRRHAEEISRADIVYLSSGAEVSSILAILPAILIARYHGKRVVLHFGLLESEKYLSRWRNLLNPIFRMAHQIVVNSRYTAAVFSRYGLPAKTVISPADVDVIEGRQIDSVQPKILVDRPLEAIYNVACVLAAFRIVKQKYPRAEMMIAGEGSQRWELERQIERGRISGVTFVDAPDVAARRALLKQADMYVNASLLDDAPLSIIEALASGLPVVTTDAGGIPHIVKDRVNGLTVPVSDYALMAERIIELIEHPELVQQLSQQGVREAGRFSWGATRAGWVSTLATGVRE